MHRKRIFYLSGTRADYNPLRCVLKEIDKHFDLSIIVTGMHTNKKHGDTIREIENDGLKIEKIIKLYPRTDNNYSMVEFIGKLIIRLTRFFKDNKPDIMLLVGDRGEQFAGAIVAAHLNIPIAHISGGDVSKSIDDAIRNTITKFAHIHLAGTKQSAERIRKMNEEHWRVNMVGTPINTRFSKVNIYKYFNVNKNKPLLLLIQHPITTQSEQSGKQMRVTLEAIKELEYQTIIIYPCSDSGSNEMIKIIKKYKYLPFIRTYKNIESDIFMSLLRKIDVLIGNSSTGILEAPFFKLPVVNIGIRQKGRERGNNVIDVGYNKDDIKKGILTALNNKFRKGINKNPYVSEKLVEKEIVKVLLKTNIDILEKTPVY